MATLYIETNLIVGIATGRDADAERLLHVAPPGLDVALPDICILEAYTWLEGERKRRHAFEQEVYEQVTQLGRDVISRHAASLRQLLVESRLQSQSLLRGIDSRLFWAVDQIAVMARLIPLSGEAISASRSEPIIDKLADNLILQSILHDARARPGGSKALLSGNARDFGRPGVKQALAAVGVAKYFTKAQDALGWLSARGTTESDPSAPA